jgi:hypothetical protein
MAAMITEWNPEEGGFFFLFLSFVVVNGIVGMQRAGGNEAEYFYVSSRKSRSFPLFKVFRFFVWLNRRTIQKKKERKRKPNVHL